MGSEQDMSLEARLFVASGKSLKELEEKQFERESELQHTIESSMGDMLGVDYINSEVRVNNFRIDTIGFDRGTKSFVIIEYKRNKSASVIDQGTAYLTLLKENRAHFILEYNKKFKRFLEDKDFNWDHSRVILMARAFNAHQRQAANKPGLQIELYEIRRYAGGVMLLNPVHRVKKPPKQPLEKRAKKTHPQKTTSMKNMYNEIKNDIVALDGNIQVRPKKWYTAFTLRRNFAWIVLWKNSIDVTLSATLHTLDDPKKMIEDVTNIGHRGGGNLRVKITSASEIPYLMTIIKQILKEMNA